MEKKIKYLGGSNNLTGGNYLNCTWVMSPSSSKLYFLFIIPIFFHVRNIFLGNAYEWVHHMHSATFGKPSPYFLLEFLSYRSHLHKYHLLAAEFSDMKNQQLHYNPYHLASYVTYIFSNFWAYILKICLSWHSWYSTSST